jgi:Ca-activated chloride channel homolog
LTTDLEGHWSKNWIQWAALQPFWDRVLVWLHPNDERDSIPIHEARMGFSANRPFLDLFLYEDIGADSQFRYVVNGSQGKTEGALQKLATGHYQAALPISAPGDYRIELTEERRGRRVAYPLISYSLPYALDDELPRSDFNLPLLTALAQASGGEINPRFIEQSKKQDVTNSYRPLHQPLIISAGVLFLLEIIARKLFFAEA